MRPEEALVTARSPRVVVLLPDPDALPVEPTTTFERVLEWFGRVWGGGAMLCLPTSGGAVPPVFRRLAKAYDPDLCLGWRHSIGSYYLANPTSAQQLIATRAQRMNDDRRRELESSDGALTSPLLVGAPVHTGILEPELSTFSRLTSDPPLVAHHLQTKFRSPLLYAADLYRQTSVNAPSGRLDLDTSALDPWLRLFAKLQLGVPALAKDDSPLGRYLPDETYQTFYVQPEEQGHLLSICLTGNAAPNDPPSWASSSTLETAPARQSLFGLLEFAYGSPEPRQFLLVIGDTVSDACLYLCWRRLYGEGSAAWLPAAMSDHPQIPWVGTAAELVRDMFVPTNSLSRPITGFITSCSLSTEQLTMVRTTLMEHHWHAAVAPAIQALIVESPDLLPVKSPRDSFTACKDVFDTPVSVMVSDNGEVASTVRSPVPYLFQLAGASPVRVFGNWIADVVVGGVRLPARSSALSAAINGPLSGEILRTVRIGRTGTAYTAVNEDASAQQVPVTHALNGVLLKSPSMEDLLGALLPNGWSLKLSDAGSFYDGTAALMGGLGEVIEVWRNPSLRAIISAFVRPSSTLGVMLTDERQYLHTFDIRKATAQAVKTRVSVQEVTAYIDRFIAKRLLRRGLILKCTRCKFTRFVALGRLDQSFECERCRFEQTISSANWCSIPPHEPRWFYALDEVVYQAFREHIEGPALALVRLGALAREGRYLWSFELLQNGVIRLEADFAVLSNGRLAVGEAKSNGMLGTTPTKRTRGARKTVRAASLLRADTVVFATTTGQWEPSSLEAIAAEPTTLDSPQLLILSNLA